MDSKDRLNILLIEDDEDDHVLLLDVLDQIDDYQFNLDWIASYQEALETISENEYDLTFVDYLLGAKNGIDFIREATHAGAECPMVLLTGKGNKVIDKQAMEEGASDFLVKSDISPQTMERCIRYSVQRYKMVRAIKEGEQKFRQLFERSIDAVYLSDTKHCLMDANPSFENLVGLEREGLSSIHLKDIFVHQEDYDRFTKELENSGHVKDFETYIKTSESSSMVSQITSVIRTDHQEKKTGYQGIIRDMTQKKKQEMELIMAERLSMTGKIARSMAHEIRNPLTNLELALGQLRAEFGSENEDSAFFLDIIDRNTKRIGQLITEMLDSSKPRELNLEQLCINDLIEEATLLVKDRITLKGMHLDLQLDRQVDDIAIDSYSMKIVFVNLMVNAIEAMTEQAGILTIRSSQDQDQIYIEVTDNGKGIPEEDLKRLFDPFYTNKQGGMGLGLTSTQNIVASHHGTINVRSKVGEGTTFTITLKKS